MNLSLGVFPCCRVDRYPFIPWRLPLLCMLSQHLPSKNRKRRMACCTVANLRRLCFPLSLILVGVILGVVMNHYGLIMENIRVDLTLRVEESGNTSAMSQRLLKDLPQGFSLSSAEDQFVVPNIVHFIWFGKNKEMCFINYVSMLSAHKIQKPDVLMLHCNFLPVGEYWEKLWREVPIKIVHREPPESIHGQKLLHMYHKGDVAKMEILLEYGGIYLDYDVIVLRSFDPLRVYDATLGKEKPPKFIAGIIVARKNAPFVKLWYESYRNNYRPIDWDFNCARVTYQLYQKRPDLLHVEPYRFTTPDWTERENLWNKVIDWKGMGLYVIHVMLHLNWQEYTPENVKSLNSTFGQVVRYIYYGSPSLIT